ncbi:MAG: glycosyltransferase family 2 protein, partial [Chloroflexota bacterium]
MRLSIVTSLYRSSAYIEAFYERISTVAEAITPNYEVVFVNDGSPDDSVTLAMALFEQDPERVCVIDLSRNYGHHRALMTGLAHATGDLIYLTDVDLEEPPELLAQFYEVYTANESADVVYGQASNRDGGLGRSVGGGLYYRLLRNLTGM